MDQMTQSLSKRGFDRLVYKSDRFFIVHERNGTKETNVYKNPGERDTSKVYFVPVNKEGKCRENVVSC